LTHNFEEEEVGEGGKKRGEGEEEQKGRRKRGGGREGEEEEKQQKQQLQASTKSNHKLQHVADYEPVDRLKEGTQIFILLSVQQKVERETVFHHLHLTALNNWILLSSCGAKYTNRDFRLILARKSTEEAGKCEDRPTHRLAVRPSVGAKNVLLLKDHNKHWPAKSSTQMHCCLCACQGQKTAVYKCTTCDVGLFEVPCFTEYDTKVNL
jgi:hypothetical protein